MADIRITVEGARGVGKTTFVKYLFGLLANSTYFVERVRDSNPVDSNWIVNLAKPQTPRRRVPRSVEICILEPGGDFEATYVEYEEDYDED